MYGMTEASILASGEEAAQMGGGSSHGHQVLLYGWQVHTAMQSPLLVIYFTCTRLHKHPSDPVLHPSEDVDTICDGR